MIVERYDPVNLFEMVPKLKLEMEPELAQLDQLLEDDVLFARVKDDLARRYPNSARLGRRSTPVEVILRMLVVKRLYDWSYEQTEHFVSDSIVLRQFCRLYLESVPDDTTLIRWANQVGSQTLASLNDRVVELARSLIGHPRTQAKGGFYGSGDEHPPSHRQRLVGRWSSGHKPTLERSEEGAAHRSCQPVGQEGGFSHSQP